MSWWVMNLKPPSRVRNLEVINLTVEEASTTDMPNLPKERINDILLRLPVKSLLKFKCVSKSWRSLISDPRFIKDHLHMSATNDNHANHRLLMISKHGPYFSKSFSLHSIFNESCLDVMELPHPYPRDCSNIVGSCNGLLCITHIDNTNIFLCNPSTRESRQLPDPGFKLTRRFDLIYGLGYDYSIDDYKLVVICNSLPTKIYNAEMNIYTLRTNSWRKIQPYNCGLPILSDHRSVTGIFISGALIWPAESSDNYFISHYPPRILKIAAFDLANEKWQELPTPVIAHDNKCKIGVLRECLYFIVNYEYVYVDLWVMKEYGVSESWTKLTTVPYVGHLLSFNNQIYLPIWLSNNCEILLQFKSLWIIYDSGKNIIKCQEIDDSFADSKSFEPCVVYIESLVSPNPMLRTTMRDNADFLKKKKQRTSRWDIY